MTALEFFNMYNKTMEFNKPHIYKRKIVETGKYYIGKHKGGDKYYYGSGKDYKTDLKKYKVIERTKATGSTYSLLNKGMVPGIIYGKGTEPTQIAFEDKIY